MDSCSLKIFKKARASLVQDRATPPITGSNTIPLGRTAFDQHPKSSLFGRLNSFDLLRNARASRLPVMNKIPAKNKEFGAPFKEIPGTQSMAPKSPRVTIPSTNADPSCTNLNLNLSLNLGHNPSPSSSTEPTFGKPLSSIFGRRQCSRCLSFAHWRPNCLSRVRCASCFRLGHITLHCVSRIGSRD